MSMDEHDYTTKRMNGHDERKEWAQTSEDKHEDKQMEGVHYAEGRWACNTSRATAPPHAK